MKYSGEILSTVTAGAFTDNQTLIPSGLAYNVPATGATTNPFFLRAVIPFNMTNTTGGYQFVMDLSFASLCVVTYKVVDCTTLDIVDAGVSNSVQIDKVPPSPGDYYLEMDIYIEGMPAGNMELLFATSTLGAEGDLITLYAGGFFQIIPA